MYDKSLILDGLHDIDDTLLHVLNRTSNIKTVEDFVLTPHGVDMLDVAAIRLMAVGEEINKIDKRTKGTLLPQYPEIEWNKIVAFRNFIAHGYFKVDAKVIFDTLQNDVKPLLSTIQQMITDLKK